MRYDTEGTYTLIYTAEDECGNTVETTRQVIVSVYDLAIVGSAVVGTAIVGKDHTS